MRRYGLLHLLGVVQGILVGLAGVAITGGLLPLLCVFELVEPVGGLGQARRLLDCLDGVVRLLFLLAGQDADAVGLQHLLNLVQSLFVALDGALFRFLLGQAVASFRQQFYWLGLGMDESSRGRLYHQFRLPGVSGAHVAGPGSLVIVPRTAPELQRGRGRVDLRDPGLPNLRIIEVDWLLLLFGCNGVQIIRKCIGLR